MPVVLGHGPGQGCDFCDNLRLERANGSKEQEDEEEEEWERAPVDDLDTIAETTFDTQEEGKGMPVDDSQTLRAMQEEQIIGRYLKSSCSSSSSSIYHPPPSPRQKSKSVRRRDEGAEEEKKKRASQWARSYTRLVDGL